MDPTPWPCATTPYDSCPGLGHPSAHGGDGGHCTACHRLYTGYVLLCPVHDAAPAMLAFLKRNLAFIEMFADGLRPLWGWDTFDCWLAEQRALVARADGKCRRGCGRPADHLEDFDCNDWPEAA